MTRDMQIHTKQNGEFLSDIAKKYEIGEDYLRMINEVGERECCDGEELLIMTPTRSYKGQFGDTVERLAIRFGVNTAEIYAQNPQLRTREIIPGETISIKQPPKRFGMGVANGYFYKDCKAERLAQAMPYLTYITFAAGVADDRGVRANRNYSETVELVKKEDKIPLIRIYDKFKSRYKSDKNSAEYAERIIDLAMSDGYKGVVLDACDLSDSAEEFSSFLMILRKMMIGCDLILITEIDENSPIQFSEYADGSVLYYPKYALDNPPSFEEGERRILSDFACRGESAKVLIDLPSLVKTKDGYTGITDAMNTAHRGGCRINKNESTLLSHFSDKKQGDCIFPSLDLIRSIYQLANEYDYMGISFDIMRTPLSHIMMYNSMFKTSYYSNVRTREGCSRVSEE